MATASASRWSTKRKKLLSIISGSAAIALVGGSLVVAGIGAQKAAADQFEPTVNVTSPQTVVLGEDLIVGVSFTNTLSHDASNNKYNLSAGVVIPAHTDIISTPWPLTASFGPGKVVPGTSVNGDSCAALGLESANPPQTGAECQVPADSQYLVFENFSDLPSSATTQAAELVLRPQVNTDGSTGFNVNDTINVRVNAYTSSNERFIPAFPGSSGRGDSIATSASGKATGASTVRALQITKTETVSPENELLRGVHEGNGTVFELRVRHTGEGNLSNAQVVDYLPASLEYLGSCGVDDSTTRANGTDGVDEYTDAAPLNTVTVGDDCLQESKVETIEMTAEIADLYLDADGNRTLVVGKVYTKVTWDVGTWLQSNGGAKQVFPGTEGIAAETVIRYRAGVPLFENELFSNDDVQRLGDRGQGANLDNNTGVSTRHGTEEHDDRAGKSASSVTNLAAAKGNWKGETSEDFGTETVDIVDVRVVKEVRTERTGTLEEGWSASATFTHGNIADYRLNLATSEYVSAVVGERPNRLVDDLANGLCPIYPKDITSKLTNGGSAPLFRLGDPNIPQEQDSASRVVELDEFNAAVVDTAKLSECGWGENNFTDDAIFEGMTLTGLAFDPASGHFFQDLQLDAPAALDKPNATHQVVYSARQNSRYLTSDGANGATSSLDTIENNVEIEATTTARDGVNGLENSNNVNAGDQYWAHDDSTATLSGDASSVTKQVLKNDPDLGVPSSAEIANSVRDDWTKSETKPFGVGDDVWFKIHWESAVGTDVRNPILEDFLPAGVEFDETQLSAPGTNQGSESSNLRVLLTDNGQPLTGNYSIGSCGVDDTPGLGVEEGLLTKEAYEAFIGDVDYDDGAKKLTWNLGSADCYIEGNPSASADKFWPGGIDLDIYIKVTVTDAQAFGSVDISQNLVKYQQMNVDREIFFLRDLAEMTPDMTARLIKGIETNTHPQGSTNPNGVNTNVDGETVVQGTEVTFRLDVTSPSASTRGYEIWDALPEGILAADVDTDSFGAAPWVGSSQEAAWSSPQDFTAQVYDWDSLPADVKADVHSDYAGRSIVVWNVGANVTGSTPAIGDAERQEQGFTLNYTLNIPDGSADGRAAQLEQQYHNTASIVEYTINNNGAGAVGDGTTIVVSAPESGEVANGGNTADRGTQGSSVPVSKRAGNEEDGQFGVPADFMTDPSHVYLPAPDMSKTLVKTEVGTSTGGTPGADHDDLGTNNPNNAITQGEYATFEYSVTIPANTSVANAQISDRGNFLRGNTTVGYEIIETATKFFKDGAELTVSTDGGAVMEFRGTAEGELKFPNLYHNATNTDQVFSVQITVWVKDQDGTELNGLDNHTPVLEHGQNLVNRATFEYDNANASGNRISMNREATVQYVEPEPTITKSANPTEGVSANDTVTFTLQASNPAGHPTSFDTVVFDCVPNGLTNVQIVADHTDGTATAGGDCAITDGAIVQGSGTGTLITWTVGALNSGSNHTLEYTAEIDPLTGAGQSYTNTTEITGYTLPNEIGSESTELRRGDRVDSAEATVTAVTADIVKGVKLASDESGEFEESLVAPIGDTVKYEVDVVLHPNINYYDVAVTDVLPEGLAIDESTVEIRMTSGTDPPVPVTDDWNLNTTGQTYTWTYGQDEGHIKSNGERRVLTFTYEVLLANDAVPTDVNRLMNTAGFTWAESPDGDQREPIIDDAVVDVANPVLNITKKVDGLDRVDLNPDATFTYTVTVTNTGDTAAHHVNITDIVPNEVKIIGAVPNGGVWAPGTDDSGGSIVWTDLDPISHEEGSNTLTLTYQAKFVDSERLSVEEDAAPYINVIEIERYESFDEGGRVYEPGKDGVAPAQDDAGVTPLFPHVVPVKSVSDPIAGETYGVAHVGEKFNWTLTVTNEGAGVAKDISVTDVLPANWTYVEGSAKLGGLALSDPEQTTEGSVNKIQTLVWHEAQIRESAAGSTPLASGSSFVITFDAVPTEAALTTAGTGIKIAPHTNNLSVTATDNQGQAENADGDYVGDEDTADAYIAEADLVMTKTTVPAEEVPAGTSNVHAWNLVVSNEGPDTAEGPITVTDTTSALPDGIVVTGANGDGWVCEVPVRDADGTTTFDCARSNSDEALASGEEFAPITVMVDVAADQTAATVSNSATVNPGKTFDPEDENNADSDELTTTTEADLALTKVISAPVDPEVVTAGESITWEITARNIGPSDSLSSGDEPITITDTVPAGVTVTAASENASWSVVSSNGFPAQPGDVITWTYLGDRIEANTIAPAVSVAATILPSHTNAITNAAIVLPGETPDPNYVEDPSDENYPGQNNYDEVTTTAPVVAATLSIDKVRVVANGAGGYRLADPQNREDDIVAGDSVFYQITVTNNGPSDATGVTVVDETPAGLSFINHADVVGEWAYNEGGATSEYPQGAPDGRVFGTFTLTADQAPGVAHATQFVVEYDTLETLDPTTVVHNWAEVTSENWDENDPGDPWDRDDDRSNSSRIVDLGVVKSHGGAGPFTPGTAVEYTIVVTNHGPSSTPGAVTIEDSLPTGMSYVEGTASVVMPAQLAAPVSAEPSLSGTDNRVLEWVLGDEAELFASGSQITITYDALIDENVRELVALTNVVTVDGTEPDNDPTNNRDDDEITTGPTSATMTIVKEVQANDGTWAPITAKTAGTSATWRVTITNEGPSATPVTFSDEMPTGVTLTGLNGTGWDCDVDIAACAYTANGGLHPVGSSVITIMSDINPQVPPTAAPGLVNWGEIRWTDGSSDENNASDDAAVTTDRVADLGIVKQALDPADGEAISEAVAGETFWYTLEVTNHGPSAAVGPMVVNDELPDGIHFVRLLGASANLWEAAADEDEPKQVTFTRSDTDAGLAVGETVTIRMLALVDPSVAADSELTNVGTIDASTLDPNGDPNDENNSDQATVNTVRKSNLTVDKGHISAAPVDEFEVNDEVAFTIDVTNDGGPSNASDILVTDTLPAGLEFVGIAGDGWALDSATVNDDGTTTVIANYAGEIAPQESTGTLEIVAVVTVAIGDNTQTTNEVCVSGVGVGQTNTNGNSCDTDTITVVPLADLDIGKSLVTDADDVTAGEALTWQVDVRNLGPSASLSTEDNPITIEDTIPVGVHSVEDPSTDDWLATVTRNGDTSEFPARAGDVITWTFQGDRIVANPDEGADPAFTISLTGVVEAGWTDGEILNQVTIIPGDTRDPVEPNNESEVPVTPGDVTDVSIGKTRVVQVDGEWVVAAEQDPVPNFVPGEDISYRITVINDGPADAREVTVLDETPRGLTYASHESIGEGEWIHSSGGANNAGETDDRWDTFTLEGTQQVGAHNKREFVITYATDSAMQHNAEDPLINWAEVDAENDRTFNEVPQRDRDNANSTRSADLSIVKTHTTPVEGGVAVAGEHVDYRLLVTNHGPSVSDEPINVIDMLPADFSYVEDTAQISVNGEAAVAAEPGINGAELTWFDITDGIELMVGGEVEITFAVLIDSDHDPADEIINKSVVDGPNDNNIENNRSNDPINVRGFADLTIEKVAVTAEDETTAGETVTWRITPRNVGPSTSLSTVDAPITVTDTLPEGVSALVSDPSTELWLATTSNPEGWSAATAGDTITWVYQGDRFEVGAAQAIEITAIIDAGWIGGDSIENIAAIAPGDTPETKRPEDPQEPNEDTSVITPGDRTVIDIAKNRVVQVDGEWAHATSLDPMPTVTPGETVSYRIDVVNNGPAVARDVTVVDPIPAGLSDAQIIQLDGFGDWGGETATCEDGLTDLAEYDASECLTATLDGTLGVGVSEVRSFIVTFATDPALDIEEELINWAQARATNVPEDERPDDIDSTENRAIADLSIVKKARQESVLAGDSVDYDLVVRNEGPSIARGPITVSDRLPLGMTYVADSAVVTVAGVDSVALEPEIESAQGSELLTWQVLDAEEYLAPGATVTVTLQTMTAGDRIAPDGLTNVAQVSADDDSNPLNNESEATVVVDPLATLEVVKTAVSDFKVGELGTYAITVTNHGPTADPGPITVTDVLPKGLTFASSTDDSVEVDSQTVTWLVSDGLEVGERVELNLDVLVGKAAFPSVENVVTIETPSELTPDSVLSDSVTVQVAEADEIPNTGGTIGLVLLFAGVLLLAGTATFMVRSRRREELQV